MGFADVVFKEKWPLRSVTTPLEVPFSTTLTPISGSPLASFTTPENVFCCVDCSRTIPLPTTAEVARALPLGIKARHNDNAPHSIKGLRALLFVVIFTS